MTTYENFNKTYDTSTTGTTTVFRSNPYCKHRLPCGYCELFKKWCITSTEYPVFHVSEPTVNPCSDNITIEDYSKKDTTKWVTIS